MRINSEKLSRLAEGAGMSPEQLAEALPKPSDRRKQAELAARKVRNWMGGKNHPAAKPADIAALAGALGCQAKDLVSFRSTYRFARSSPRKSRLVVDLIRGKPVDDALELLAFSPKRAAVMVQKALKAAVHDAEAYEADRDALFVSEAFVQEGFRIKRFQPKDRGRAHPIIKRTGHITVAVEEVG